MNMRSAKAKISGMRISLMKVVILPKKVLISPNCANATAGRKAVPPIPTRVANFFIRILV